MIQPKSARIQGLLDEGSHEGEPSPHDPHYLGFFRCFNAAKYYEAHDVLEALWLRDRRSGDARYFQGLIQLAGAFVHLQKGRLKPAYRLFGLALANFDPYPARHLGIDLGALRELILGHRDFLASRDFSANPWSDQSRPNLRAPA